MNHRSLRQPFFAGAALFALTACGGGGGGGAPVAPPPTANLRATDVRMMSTDPNAGHEMQLSTTIASNEPVADVPVGYILMNREDVDNQREEVRQHVLGTSLFPTVQPGEAEYQSIVTIPEGLREDQEWYLIANVDPQNVIPETDEDDNMPTSDSRVPVRIGNANTDLADLVVESVDVDQDAAILQPPIKRKTVGNIADVDDHDFSATLVMTTTGAKPIEDVDVSASITIPGSDSHALMVWDEANERYVAELLADVAPSIPNTVHLDLRIPDGGPRDAIEAYLKANGPSSFKVTIGVNQTAQVAEWENGVQRHADRAMSDNMIESEVVIMLPPTPDPKCDDLVWNQAYKKDWNASVFSIGVDLTGGASLDGRGAIARANASMPVALFGQRSNAVDLRAFGRVTPRENAPTDSQFNIDLDVFGVSVFTRSSTDPSYKFEETMSFTRSRELRRFLFVGPIPLEVRAVGSGTLGFTARATLDPARLEVVGEAFGNIQGLAEASVSLIIVRAGVGGGITLVDNRFSVRGQCSLSAPQNGRLTGTLQFDVTNDLRGPSGRLFLFAEYPEITWCWVIIPCGLRQVRAEHTIASFRTFRKVDVLYNDTRTATICLNQSQ